MSENGGKKHAFVDSHKKETLLCLRDRDLGLYNIAQDLPYLIRYK